MKPFPLLALCVAAAFGSTSRCTSQDLPHRLFNGRDLAGWHVDVPAADSNARLRSAFAVRNGLLVSLGEPRGHLLTDSSYRDYRLEIEYRFAAAPGNAGVLVHASTPRALYGMFPRSIEVQMEHGNAGDFWCILEDIHVPDMERRRGPPAQWGTTEGQAPLRPSRGGLHGTCRVSCRTPDIRGDPRFHGDQGRSSACRSYITVARRDCAARGTGTQCPRPPTGAGRDTGASRFRRAFTQQGPGRTAYWRLATTLEAAQLSRGP